MIGGVTRKISRKKGGGRNHQQAERDTWGQNRRRQRSEISEKRVNESTRALIYEDKYRGEAKKWGVSQGPRRTRKLKTRDYPVGANASFVPKGDPAINE